MKVSVFSVQCSVFSDQVSGQEEVSVFGVQITDDLSSLFELRRGTQMMDDRSYLLFVIGLNHLKGSPFQVPGSGLTGLNHLIF